MARTPDGRGADGRRRSVLPSDPPSMPKTPVEVLRHVSELLQQPRSDNYPDENECSAAYEFASSSQVLSQVPTDLQAEQ